MSPERYDGYHLGVEFYNQKIANLEKSKKHIADTLGWFSYEYLEVTEELELARLKIRQLVRRSQHHAQKKS